jgi:serine/threonine-protein kinase RsbW
VEIRQAHRHDADGLVELFRRCYGTSYDHAWAYDAAQIRNRWSSGAMTSVVGVTPEGEVVGHLALDFARPGAKVGESGQALVDPRFRGHHLFETLKTFLAEWAQEHGLYGLYSEATAAHPYSQRGNLAIGAHETGFLLGYIPAGVRYRELAGSRSGHRRTATLMYLRTNPEPHRVAHPPAGARRTIERVYEAGAFDRELGDGAHAPGAPGSSFSLVRDHDHSAAILGARSLGSDLHDVVERETAALTKEGVACVYLDLPLAAPEVAAYGDALHELGYVFGCILPEVREDGDVLRLQLLNGIEPHLDEVVTASEFGEELLDAIRSDLGTDAAGPQ